MTGSLPLRVLTGGVLLAGFLALVLLLEPEQFALPVGVILALGAFEWARLCKLDSGRSLAYAAAAASAFALLAWRLWPISAGDAPEHAILIAATIFWCVLVPLWLRAGMGSAPAWLLLVTGAAVLLPCALAMLAVPGARLLGLFALVWLADTSAYFAGVRFGRHKLAPKISPGKSWEGVGGAMIACVVYAVVCAFLVPELKDQVRNIVWVPFIAATLFVCAISVIGDLFESALKRRAAVKDSGTLLPGHGGVLDRIDSATAALPAAVLLWHWIVAR